MAGAKLDKRCVSFGASWICRPTTPSLLPSMASRCSAGSSGFGRATRRRRINRAGARRLGVSVETFYRRRRDLDAAGFPAPRSPFRARWSSDEVDGWINGGQGEAETPDPPSTDDAWRAKLLARAEQLSS
jgi:predicted DNA-binding transcriptional regulator AlpA